MEELQRPPAAPGSLTYLRQSRSYVNSISNSPARIAIFYRPIASLTHSLARSSSSSGPLAYPARFPPLLFSLHSNLLLSRLSFLFLLILLSSLSLSLPLLLFRFSRSSSSPTLLLPSLFPSLAYFLSLLLPSSLLFSSSALSHLVLILLSLYA